MSVRVISWVLDHSEETLGRRLVLLALADYAHDDGTMAWPSIENIARKARISSRQVQRCLRQLEESGAIEQSGVSEFGTHVYTVRMPGRQIVRGATNRAESVSKMSPNPSLEPVNREGAKAPSLATGNGTNNRNPVWDALVEIFGEPGTRQMRTLRGRVCRTLTQAGATPEEIHRRARSWPRHFDDATLTETALEKHWDRLGRKPLRAGTR